jgi:hypothetical protein
MHISVNILRMHSLKKNRFMWLVYTRHMKIYEKVTLVPQIVRLMFDNL